MRPRPRACDGGPREGLLLLRAEHVRQGAGLLPGGGVLHPRHPGRGGSGHVGGATRAEPGPQRGRVRPPVDQQHQGDLRRAAHVPHRLGAARVPAALRRVQEKANAVLAIHGRRGLAPVHHRGLLDLLRRVRQLQSPQHYHLGGHSGGAVLPPAQRHQPLPEDGGGRRSRTDHERAADVSTTGAWGCAWSSLLVI